jgi:hypothetical protein
MGFPNNGEPGSDERGRSSEYLSAPEWAAPDSGRDDSRQEMADFIAIKQQYYMEKFDYLEQKQKLSWNWAAFFFGLYWLLYRKMYKFFLLFFLINIIMIVCVPDEYTISYIAMPIAMGWLGNFLYMFHVKEKLKAASELNDLWAKDDYIRKKGGVGWLGTVVFLAIILFIGAVFMISDYGGTGQDLLIPDETPPWRIR